MVEIGLKSVFLKTVSNSMQCIEQENRMQISTTELSAKFQYLTNGGITELISKSISFIQRIEILGKLGVPTFKRISSDLAE